MKNIVDNFINMLQINNSDRFRDELRSENKKPKKILTSFDELFIKNGSNMDMNFFPSENKGSCCEIAMFVSLNTPVFGLKLKKDQMIPIDEVIKTLVQQVLGTCYPINKKIILLTDKVDTDIFDPWIGNLRTIKKMGNEIEIFYLHKDGTTKIVNDLIRL
jgi:hypothetical protein